MPIVLSIRRALMLSVFVLLLGQVKISLGQNRPVLCVQCTTVNGCFECAGAGNGGDTCKPASCMKCTLTGACSSGKIGGFGCDPGGDAQSSSDVAIGRGPRVVISDTGIRQVAALDTDFGRAMTFFLDDGVDRGVSKFFLGPLHVSDEDFAFWMRPEKESPVYFKKYNAEGAKAYASGVLPLTFDVTVTSSSDEDILLVRIEAGQDSKKRLAHSSLSLVLVKAQSVPRQIQVQTVKPDKELWEVSSFEMN